jgi:hypothetical protein
MKPEQARSVARKHRKARWCYATFIDESRAGTRVEKHYITTSCILFDSITRFAVVGARPPRKPIALDGIDVLSIDELMGRIKDYVGKTDPASKAIFEVHGYLRAVQFAVWFGNKRQSEGDGRMRSPWTLGRPERSRVTPL